MKTLYESILDDEDVLMNNTSDYVKATIIYSKIRNREQLTKIDLDWINNKVGVYKIDRNELEILLFIIGREEKKYHKLSLNWLDVSNVKNMGGLFFSSKFNGDISKWDVSGVENMNGLFCNSIFNGDISKWDVSKVKDMCGMFKDSQFNSDISKWKISSKCDTYNMFLGCTIKDKYKPKI
jgi:hypothetical protein